METDIPTQLLLILVLTLINAFFASAEMAMVSINKNKIRLLAQQGNHKAILIEQLLREPTNFLSTIQVCITLAGFFSSASAATGIADDVAILLVNIPYAKEISLIVVTLILSYFTLVFGELVPKKIALSHAEGIALFSVKPIMFISKISKPFVLLLSFSVDTILKIFGFKAKDEAITEEEIISIVSQAESEGSIDSDDKTLIHAVFTFNDLCARDIVIPRVKVVGIPLQATRLQISEVFKQSEYSRLPVYRENLDNIVGILHEKAFNHDLIDSDLCDLIQKPIYVQENTKIANLLKQMQESKMHISIVQDMHGGTVGIITLEDILEHLIGDIFDETD